MNGAILGMTQREIRSKFDEIVDFAGVERFLDTPVKRYSSGMYVRLAFAVAAHLEPEILVVDEVLAVGDAEFQKKCLGKMRDVSQREGRTVLFVSHNLAAVADLTSRAIVLNARVGFGGCVPWPRPSRITCLRFPTHRSTKIQRELSSPHLKRVEVITSELNGVHQFGRALEVKFLIRHDTPMSKACFSFNIVNQFQNAVVHAWAFPPEVEYGSSSGETLLVCRFPALKLNIGHYHLRTHLTEPPGMEIYEKLDGLCPFEVIRIEDTRLWGWDPSASAYFEDNEWIVASNPNGLIDGVVRRFARRASWCVFGPVRPLFELSRRVRSILSDGFEHETFVINLPYRTDRRSEMQRELSRIGWNAQFFPAIRPASAGSFSSIGAHGCFLSHLAVLKAARNSAPKGS